MSNDNHRWANKELEGSPALITPVELESAFIELSGRSQQVVNSAREFSGLLHMAKRRDGKLSAMEGKLLAKRLPVFCGALNINMEGMLHPVADCPQVSGPKQGDARMDILSEIEDHVNGRTGLPLNETELGLDLAASIGRSADQVFNTESEGDGIQFGAEPAATEEEAQVDKGMHTGVKIILNEDGMKLDFESSQAVIMGGALTFSNNYISSVRSVLSQCCRGQCAARRPDVTYIGSTPEEVTKRLGEANAVTAELLDGSIGKFFWEITQKAYELAAAMNGKTPTPEQEKMNVALEKALEDKISSYRQRLPYLDTSFIFNGSSSSDESIGSNSTDDLKATGYLNTLAVQVHSISYDLMIDTYCQNLEKLKADTGIDLLNVDADLRPGLSSLPFIYLRFIKTVVCGLVEHLIDLQKLSAQNS